MCYSIGDKFKCKSTLFTTYTNDIGQTCPIKIEIGDIIAIYEIDFSDSYPIRYHPINNLNIDLYLMDIEIQQQFIKL